MLNKRENINQRLLYLIAAIPGWENRGEVGRELGIEKSRWSRIIRHDEVLYDHEIISIKEFFQTYYDWVLEGADKAGYQRALRDLFEHMVTTLTSKERLDLLNMLRSQTGSKS